MTIGLRQRVPACMLGAALLTSAAAPAEAAPAEAAPDAEVRITDRPGGRQVAIAVVLQPGTAEHTVALLRGMMVHRISAELHTAHGQSAPVQWSASVSAGRGGLRTSLGRLGAMRHAVDLPRLLGVELHAGDPITIRVELSAGADAVELEIVLHYEAAGQHGSRMAVLPLQLQSDTMSEGTAWLWTQQHDGRLMAVSGLDVVGAGELLLHDVETGAVVWRETVQPRNGQAFAGAADAVRAGVLLQAGRTYRLSAIARGQTAVNSAGAEVHALIGAPAVTASRAG
jgi:hypothetical protein